MLILGLESSCDETGVALYDTTAKTLKAQVLYSQIKLHRAYGGVVPELASRAHIDRIAQLTETCLTDARAAFQELSAIAYTEGPGLGGALLIAAGFAHSLGYALNIPTIPVHHLEAHLLSPLLSEEAKPQFPFIALLVSGGHTQLFAVKAIGDYRLLGESVDDAVGEAFDKVAKLLGLAYPGGQEIENLAKKGDACRFAFPRPMLFSKNLNMSFSGLKTAVLTQILALTENPKRELTLEEKQDLAASFQAAAVEVLVAKAKAALLANHYSRLIVAGGVGANQSLRAALKKLNAEVYFPKLEWCTDNGAMIAFAGAYHLEQQTRELAFTVKPRWSLAELTAGKAETPRNPACASVVNDKFPPKVLK